MTAEPDLLPSSIAAFTEALHGDRGSLDAWLEANDEHEVAAHVEAYARANVEHAVAPLQAEVEALRAEVEMLRDAFSDEDMTAGAHWFGRYVEQKRRAEQLAEEVEALRAQVERLTFEMGCLRQHYDERTACMIVHRGSALACSAAVRAAYSEEHERAERLAEALRNSADALERLAFAIPAPNVHTPQLATLAIAMRNAAIQRTDAALRDQEEGQ